MKSKVHRPVENTPKQCRNRSCSNVCFTDKVNRVKTREIRISYTCGLYKTTRKLIAVKQLIEMNNNSQGMFKPFTSYINLNSRWHTKQKKKSSEHTITNSGQSTTANCVQKHSMFLDEEAITVFNIIQAKRFC